MSEKIFNTRIQHKYDTEANWNKAINFIPKQGELIIYDKDQNHSQIRLKIGDGTTKVNDLPFSIDEILIGTTEEITPSQVAEAIEIGKDVSITYNDATYGAVVFSSFMRAHGFNGVFTSEILLYGSIYNLVELYGNTENNDWTLLTTQLAQYSDIQVPVIGTTAEITPSQVKALMDEGKPFAITHTDSTYGTMLLNNFVYSQDINIVLSSTVFNLYGTIIGAQVFGDITNNTWTSEVFWVANANDIPTKTSQLTNDSGFVTGELPTAFYVTVTKNETTYIADKTVDEIEEAYQLGKPLYCYYTSYCIPFRSRLVLGAMFEFAGISELGVVSIRISDNWVTVEENPMVTHSDIPTALKNPHALTINGTSYDGSEAKTISGLATETYVDNKVASMVDSAPETLNTLNELAAALGDDPNFATTISGQIGKKVDKVKGKGLSTNDYTTAEKNKLSGIAEGANKTIVDAALDSTSTNPVQNKVVKEALDKKPGEIVTGKIYTIDGSNVVAGMGAEVFNNNNNANDNNIASGVYSHAEGFKTKATGPYSHAEGSWTIASNDYAHAEGYDTEASGNYSHAEGDCTKATGDRSHAEGYHTVAASYQQHVQGRYNIEDSENKYAHIIGNGFSSPATTRSNAHTVDWAGNAWFAGDVYVKSSSGYHQDEGSKKLATEDQVNGKVDKVYGKGLSTNDYTDTDKAKLDNTNIAYGTCSTAAATAEKVVVLNGNTQWSLKTGSVIMVKFDVSNSAENVKINVNNTGAYPIWYNNAEYTGTGTAYTGYANRTITYMFNGTHYVWITASYDANSTYTNAALGQGYATCSTAAATTAKVGTLSSYKLVTGGIVAVKFTNSVPANATLNINSTGAKSIYYKGAKITGDIIKAGEVATFVYSTYYHLISIDRCDQKALTINGIDYDGSTKITIDTNSVYIDCSEGDSIDTEQIELAYQSGREVYIRYFLANAYNSLLLIPLVRRFSQYEWEFSTNIINEENKIECISLQVKDGLVLKFNQILINQEQVENMIDSKLSSIIEAEEVSF